MAPGYLVTGATGVVGSAVVECLLRDHGGPIHLLVRANDDAHLVRRKNELLRHLGLDDSDSRVRAIVAHRGDVSCERLGLTESSHRLLNREVTRVIHAAGDVHMGRSLPTARKSAVGSAERIFEFADGLHQRGQLEKVEFVSTVGVGGRTPSSLEERLVDAATSFHNTYERAKWEAEMVAARYLSGGLPITVHRPSMVVGDSKTGRSIRPQIFATICGFLTGRETFGVLPRLDKTEIDLVPQDFVARAIVWSSGAHTTTGRVLHLCSGRAEATPLAELAWTARAVAHRLTGRAPRQRFVDERWLRAGVAGLRRVAPRRTKRRLTVLALLLDYLEAPKTFVNDETLRLLRAARVSLPPARSYLGRVVTNALRWIEASS